MIGLDRKNYNCIENVWKNKIKNDKFVVLSSGKYAPTIGLENILDTFEEAKELALSFKVPGFTVHSISCPLNLDDLNETEK